MKTAHLNFRSMDLGYKVASKLAAYFARKEFGLRNPAIVAWRDRRSSRKSPPALEGRADPMRWHVYGETHGGELEVAINGEYDFILADTADFEPRGASPYISVQGLNGAEMLCQANVLRIPRRPGEDACTALDEWTSKQT